MRCRPLRASKPLSASSKLGQPKSVIYNAWMNRVIPGAKAIRSVFHTERYRSALILSYCDTV